MSILYRQENDGFTHVFEMRERLRFADSCEFNECMRFLIRNSVDFSVTYGFEVFIIILEKAKKEFSMPPDKQDICDNQAKDFWSEMFHWKCVGTRPIKISDEIKAAVDYIVEYRQNDISPANPSSIIKLGPGGRIDIIRK